MIMNQNYGPMVRIFWILGNFEVKTWHLYIFRWLLFCTKVWMNHSKKRIYLQSTSTYYIGILKEEFLEILNSWSKSLHHRVKIQANALSTKWWKIQRIYPCHIISSSQNYTKTYTKMSYILKIIKYYVLMIANKHRLVRESSWGNPEFLNFFDFWVLTTKVGVR